MRESGRGDAVVPHAVPDQRVRLVAQHLVAVAVPSLSELRRLRFVVQPLLKQQSHLELAEIVLILNRVDVRPGEDQIRGLVFGSVAIGVQDLLGGRRHVQGIEDRLIEILPPVPDDEIRATQVREDQPLAQPQRRLGELLHARLLLRHDGSLFPEPAQRERVGLLLRHQHGDLRDGGLSLEHRLCRRAPVVAPPLRDDGVELHVLILQRVHQLVRHHDAQLIRLDIRRDVECV